MDILCYTFYIAIFNPSRRSTVLLPDHLLGLQKRGANQDTSTIWGWSQRCCDSCSPSSHRCPFRLVMVGRFRETYGYGSIPIHTIFRGMNIHKSQLFWCELQGDRVLTHPHISPMFFHRFPSSCRKRWVFPIRRGKRRTQRLAKGWDRAVVCVMEQILPKYLKPTIVTGTSGWLVKLTRTVCRTPRVCHGFPTFLDTTWGHHRTSWFWLILHAPPVDHMALRAALLSDTTDTTAANRCRWNCRRN